MTESENSRFQSGKEIIPLYGSVYKPQYPEANPLLHISVSQLASHFVRNGLAAGKRLIYGMSRAVPDVASAHLAFKNVFSNM